MQNDPRRDSHESILAAILSEENFWPSEPRSLKDSGLPISFIESLVLKRLSVVGYSSGRQLANTICQPFHLLERVYQDLRDRQLIVHKGAAPLNDYNYTLTQLGQERARLEKQTCSYIGPAPVPLDDYIVSAEAQTIRAESPKRKQLTRAFRDVSVNRDIFEVLGPAVNSGAGLFLYGEPGNGKTTLAQRIIRCFGQQIWIPYALIDDGQIIKLYDPSLHEIAEDENSDLSNFDQRWVRIRRPTVIVGGELTLDSLEIRHDPVGNVSEAPLQMKSNCGCFLIDDFGRQRVEPAELLNRWIVPLENRVDFLTLASGKKIQVPFEQLIVFSTNLDPSHLVDEAFLRRIPYKIFVRDPSPEEFHALFKHYAAKFHCDYRPKVIDNLLANHYLRKGRSLRRCHPRDLLQQVRNYCSYNDIRIEMRDEYFDHVVHSYFSDDVKIGKPIFRDAVADSTPLAAAPQSDLPDADAPPVLPTPESTPEPTLAVHPVAISSVVEAAMVAEYKSTTSSLPNALDHTVSGDLECQNRQPAAPPDAKSFDSGFPTGPPSPPAFVPGNAPHPRNSTPPSQSVAPDVTQQADSSVVPPNPVDASLRVASPARPTVNSKPITDPSASLPPAPATPTVSPTVIKTPTVSPTVIPTPTVIKTPIAAPDVN